VLRGQARQGPAGTVAKQTGPISLCSKSDRTSASTRRASSTCATTSSTCATTVAAYADRRSSDQTIQRLGTTPRGRQGLNALLSVPARLLQAAKVRTLRVVRVKQPAGADGGSEWVRQAGVSQTRRGTTGGPSSSPSSKSYRSSAQSRSRPARYHGRDRPSSITISLRRSERTMWLMSNHGGLHCARRCWRWR
jgi:hypothetical protein